MPRLATILMASLVFAACDGGEAKKKAAEAADEKKAVDEEKAAAKKAEDAAARAEVARKAEEARKEADRQAYDAAKGALEPLAKLPKKHPKGFGGACVEMLAQYDTFMKAGLVDAELTKWTESQENRERRMRRDCHNRPVEVVVCETAVLKKAPPGTAFGHIMQVCSEKFDVPR